jgi:hypothetical protein
MEPREQGLFGSAEDSARVVVPGGAERRALERAGEDVVRLDSSREELPDLGFEGLVHDVANSE